MECGVGRTHNAHTSLLILLSQSASRGPPGAPCESYNRTLLAGAVSCVDGIGPKFYVSVTSSLPTSACTRSKPVFSAPVILTAEPFVTSFAFVEPAAGLLVW